MSRSADMVMEELMQLTARGWGFPYRGSESLFEELLGPMAAGLAGIEELAESLMDETDPRTATLCLTDFERVLGADPCGRDLSSLPVSERRLIAFQRWTARGGASPGYFIDVAAARGVVISVEENRTSQAEFLEAGDELVGEGEQFAFAIRLQLTNESLFTAGEGVAGDLLYDLNLSDIECDIRRLKPAHTEVAFIYS